MRTWTQRLSLVVVAAALTPPVRAEPPASKKTSDAFDRACVDLMRGKTPPGAEATAALREACTTLMNARIEERQRMEQRLEAQSAAAKAAAAQPAAPGAAPQKPAAGTSAAPAQPGQSVLSAFGKAGEELVGNRPRGTPGMGMQRGGQPYAWTLVTNPVGWFTGQGVNAELWRELFTKFALIGGAHYSQTAASERTVYTLGFLAGADWFPIGRNNEGLRFGPRFDFSFGRDNSTNNNTSSRLGIAGEVGYNFIASNGITGQAAFGLGGRVAGDKNDELSSAVGGEFGPYVKIGLGYSW
jgi:hypothetical protein